MVGVEARIERQCKIYKVGNIEARDVYVVVVVVVV